jgi:hypothetical protein
LTNVYSTGKYDTILKNISYDITAAFKGKDMVKATEKCIEGKSFIDYIRSNFHHNISSYWRSYFYIMSARCKELLLNVDQKAQRDSVVSDYAVGLQSLSLKDKMLPTLFRCYPYIPDIIINACIFMSVVHKYEHHLQKELYYLELSLHIIRKVPQMNYRIIQEKVLSRLIEINGSQDKLQVILEESANLSEICKLEYGECSLKFIKSLIKER